MANGVDQGLLQAELQALQLLSHGDRLQQQLHKGANRRVDGVMKSAQRNAIPPDRSLLTLTLSAFLQGGMGEQGIHQTHAA